MKTQRYDVLYFDQAPWKVGENQADRDARVRARGALPVRDCYPDSYPGRVIAVRRAGRDPDLREMADALRPVVSLELSGEQAADLAARRLRINRLEEAVPVTFDERWGRLAQVFRANFADPEAAERASEADESSDVEGTDGWRFQEILALNKRRLPRTESHTGTGLYSVKATPAHNDETQSGSPSGQVITLTTGGLGGASAWAGGYVTNATRSETRAIVSHTDDTVTLEGDLSAWLDGDDLDIYDAWSAPQAALDQLWTDQGSAAFTESQFVRIFAGTYDEGDITPNASLNSDEAAGRLLVIEGDPSDDRENILVQPSSGTFGFNVNCDNTVVRHMKLDATGVTSIAMYFDIGCARAEVSDCEIHPTATRQGVKTRMVGIIEDCLITSADGAGVQCGGNLPTSIVRRCTIRRTGSRGEYGLQAGHGMLIEGCVIDGFSVGVYYAGYTGPVPVRNCTVYDCTYAFEAGGTQSVDLLVLWFLNNIVDACDYAFKVATWPDRAGGVFAGRYELRSNCFHYDTSFAYRGAGDTKTYAEFAALADVDASGDLDATDPLLTDPAGGDFSIPPTSPCARQGVGAGVTHDVAGSAFCGHHPDIGAVTTGTAGAPARPSADLTRVEGSTVTLSVSGEENATHHAELVKARTGEVADEDSRQGDGALSLVAPELAARYFVVVWSANASGRSLPAAPLDVFVPACAGPFEEVRSAIVAALAAHAGLAEILGTDDSGAVPIYAARPGIALRVPSVVYALEGTPDSAFDRAGRWHMTLALEAWGGTPGVNDSIVGAMDECLSREPFDCTSWSVKRIRRTGDGTRWTEDGRTEFRRTEWDLVVDRLGS